MSEHLPAADAIFVAKQPPPRGLQHVEDAE